MEDAAALYTARCFEPRINTARNTARPYEADHEQIADAALLRSTWEGRRSALKAAEKGDCSWVCLVRKYCPTGTALQIVPPNRSFAPRVHFWLVADRISQGVDSERGIAWRASDLVALRQFLRIGLEESGPDHSTIARAVRIAATALEANAALRSIVRWVFKEGYRKGMNSTRIW